MYVQKGWGDLLFSAHFHQQLIDLSTFPRKDWYQLHDASHTHQLLCPTCQKPVVFVHTIFKRPSFIHVVPSDCPDETDEPSPSYNQAKRLKITEPFENTQPAQPTSHPLYHHLKACGYPLNTEQWKAVTTIDTPLLIAAGPGSGKTRVLTARAAYILQETNTNPNELLLITFTKKAATELKERLQSYQLFPSNVLNRIVCGTFHSVFYRILRYHEPMRWDSAKLLSHEWKKEVLLRQAAKSLGISEQEIVFDEMLQTFSFYKNQGKTPDDLLKTEPNGITAPLYQAYETLKQEEGLFDFDDMLLGCLQFFRDNPTILANYQQRFRYMMIDEFQDINWVQYELIQLLGISSNLCVVGDDDQTIYSFRGSSPSFLLDMKEKIAGLETIVLSTNYRSSHEIVEASKRLIRHNYKRVPKKLHATFSTKKGPVLFFPYDEEEEAFFITDYVEKAKRLHPDKTIAILCRTHAQSRALLEQSLHRNCSLASAKTIEQYYNRPIPKIVRNYFTLAVNPDDEAALKGILPSLFIKQSFVNEIRAQSVLHDVSLIEALPFAEGLPAFQKKRLETIATLLPKIKDITPERALVYLEHDLGLNDYIKKRSDENNRFDGAKDDLKQLHVAFRTFTSIPEWLDYLEELIIREKTLKNEPSNVHVLSIHQSKGLEFDEVFVLGVNQGLLPHDFALEVYKKDKDASFIEEERRLLYVAMTRARTKLFLSVLSHYQTEVTQRSLFISQLKK